MGIVRGVLIPALLASSMTIGARVLAAEEPDDRGWGELSGSVTLSSDYMFRGISNTSNLPQIQGDMTWAHGSGLYAGVWSSNTNFGGQNNSMEVDPFIGFSRPIGETGLSYDVGYWSYNYPGSRADLDGDGVAEDADFDYAELYGILSYQIGNVGLTGSLWYADNYFGDDFFDDVSSLAYHAIVSYALPMGVSVSGRVGEQTFDETSGLPDQDYTYYDVGASKAWRGFTFELRWHDTDDVQPELALSEDADGRLVFSITRSF